MQVPAPSVPGPDLVREYVTEQSTPKKMYVTPHRKSEAVGSL